MDDSNKGVSPLAANMKATSERGSDNVLDSIVKFGSAAMREALPGDDVEDVKGTPATQIRKIAAGNVPVHPSMRGAAPGPKIPGAPSWNEGAPDKKPG
jgi:hypothetical protein